jgi:hypothetical protein
VNGSIQGPGASAASTDVVSYSKQIVAAMGGTVAPGPQLSSDQLNKTGARQGQVPGSTSLVGNGGGQAPPNLVVDTQSGQLYSEDGQPYLGKALFLKGDETVVDAAGNAVDLASLERAAGYNPDLITAAASSTQAYGNGQEPPEIFTGPQGNIVTADGQPYLGMQLFMQDDQTVVDGQGNQVNLAELEQAAGYAPPPPPAPPQYYRGPNDQLVDIAGQPYLGVTMFVRGDQVLDANGMEVDLNAVIAQAGYDPNAEAVPDAPLDPVQSDASMYPPPGTPQTDLPQGEGKTGGIVRNLLALGGDYHRWRQSTLPPEPAATTKAKRKPRTNVPPLPKDHKSKKSGAVPAPATVKPTAKTTSTKVNPDTPVPGTRDMRITRQAQQEFRARKQDILNSYSGTAKLPREALQLTDGQRTRMRLDVREHMTASKQFKEAFVSVQKWNKRDPGTLTTTEHRSMVRDQQTLEMAQKAVQKTETKINGWYKKIGKKPIDTVVTIPSTQKTTPANKPTPAKKPTTPAAGPRQVAVPDAAKKAFQTEWKRFAAENAQSLTIKKTVGPKLTVAQRSRIVTDVEQHKLSQNHLSWKKAELKTLQKVPAAKLTPVQKRQLNRNQQLVQLAEQNVQTSTAKVQAWETKLGRKLTVVKGSGGKSEITLGNKLSVKTTSTKGTVKTGAVKPTPRTKATAQTQATTGMKPLSGKVLPGLLAINDAYSLYQGIKHWDDEGNTAHHDDLMRVGGSAISTYASVQAFRKGNLAGGVGLHATGLALNLLGQMTNDQD